MSAIPSPVSPSVAPVPLVSCYYLGDYERNGYDDSDFHVVYWDDIAREIKNVMYGSTRFCGGWDYSRELITTIPPDVVARIRADVYSRNLSAMTAAEIARVNEPQPESLGFGTRVRLTKSSRKGCKTPYQAGETAEVTGQYWFGTFYRNGYNQKTRYNGRVGLRMSDGRTVYAAMTVIRLDCEPDLAAVERNARAISQAPNLRCPGAWWSHCATLV